MSNWFVSKAPIDAEAGLHVTLSSAQAEQFLKAPTESVRKIHELGWDGYALTKLQDTYTLHVYTKKAYDSDEMLHNGLYGETVSQKCIERFPFKGKIVIMDRTLANLVYLEKRRQQSIPLLSDVLYELDEAALLNEHNTSSYAILDDIPMREAILNEFYDRQAAAAKENMLNAVMHVLNSGNYGQTEEVPNFDENPE